MVFDSDKIVFEIYKEATYSGRYRVVYFAELQDHNKEHEINRAMAGEHFFDGFVRTYRKEHAQETINKLLEGLNAAESVSKEQAERELRLFMPA